MYSIAHKVDLFRNISKMSLAMPDIYRFHPRTFLLPQQFSELKRAMTAINDMTERTFIVKPDRGAQGKGIFLIQDPDIVSNSFVDGNGAVAQQYIKPFLIDRLKFDLRIYVLVTSVDPLRVYIHKEGMARFCTEAYQDPRQENLDHCYSHLTNYSLNKQNNQFNQNNSNKIFNDNQEENKPKQSNINQYEKKDNNDDIFSIKQHETPFKRSLSSIMDSIRKSGKDADQLQSEIDDIIRFTMASIQPFLSSSYHSVIAVSDGKSRCFEILGFDILIDHELRPWLLEVNFMPSLTTDTEFDRILKYSVIKGALKIVDIKPNFKRLLKTRQKNISQGKKKVSLFDPEIESKIAKENTNWRQLLPLEIPSECSNEPRFNVDEEKNNLLIKKLNRLKSNYEKAIIISRETPLGAAAATTASKARMLATQLETKERKKRFSVPHTFRNSAIVFKSPLPPLHDAHSLCFSPLPKYQKPYFNHYQQIGKQTKVKRDSITNSNSETKLKSSIKLNPEKKDILSNNINSNLKLSSDSSLPINKPQAKEEVTLSTNTPNFLQRQVKMIESDPPTSGEMPIFLQFSGAKQNQVDMFEEEKRINTLKMRLEMEKSIGIVDNVYNLLGIKIKKEPVLKCSIISRIITKPVVAYKQIFNEKIVI